MRKALINCRVFSKGTPQWSGGYSFFRRGGWESWFCYPQTRESFGRKGDLITAFQFPEEVIEMIESQQWKMRGCRDNEHELEQEVQTGCKEETSMSSVKQAMEQIVQRGCEIPTFEGFQAHPSSKLTAVPALSRRWELRPPKVLS